MSPASSQLKLQIAQPLPTIDLSKTIWAIALGSSWRTRLVQFMTRRYMAVAVLHRVGTIVFFLTLVLPPSHARRAVIALVCLPMLALSLTMLFLSLDIVRLLAREHEFWFISCINALNWGSLAYMLGDERSLVVVPTWWGIQIVILLDANFRTFPTAVRSITMAIPAVLSVAVLCVFDQVHAPRHRQIHVNQQELSIPNLLVFTATTIAIFMARKVVLKVQRTHASFPGFKVIPCVFQRDILRTLLYTFDYMFATFQLLMIGVCLMILVAWAPAPTVLIATAFLWFQWLLSLDALTPPLKKRFRFRRRIGLPIIVVFLGAMAWMLVLIAFHRANSTGSSETDLVLLSFRVSDSRIFEITTVELLVGRIVTLLGWLGTRLIVEFATLGEDELMFVRGRLLYPFLGIYDILQSIVVVEESCEVIQHLVFFCGKRIIVLLHLLELALGWMKHSHVTEEIDEESRSSL
ncbi:hypothetical protein ATCC90586_001644 [Pythium insidiosum]|nr:hypothetical protein ATCC90586_001644 [Pythium insidiosum]